MRAHFFYILLSTCWSSITQPAVTNHIENGKTIAMIENSAIDNNKSKQSHLDVDWPMKGHGSNNKQCVTLSTESQFVVEWRILDLAGKVIQTGVPNGKGKNLELDLDLPKGIYILETVFPDTKSVQRISLV